MKPKMLTDIRLMTGKFRASFPHVFEPTSFEGQEPKYSLTMLFDKDDETLKLMKQVAGKIMKEKWGGKKPANFNSPFRQGDEKDYDGYSGKIYVKASSKNRPGVIGPRNEVLKDGNEFYPGCWARTAELEAPHLHAETVRRVEVALRSDLLTMVGSDVWKEVPICAPVGERLIEGYIDLVVTTPDGLLVIDYKTDSVASDEDMAAKVAHYTPQLRAYAGALKSATGLHVAGAALLFIGPQNTAAKYVRI